MKNPIDHLFKDTLEHHTLPPSERVWHKIDYHFSLKKKLSIIYRIAAGIVFVAIPASYFFISNTSSHSQKNLVHNPNPVSTYEHKKTTSSWTTSPPSVPNKKTKTTPPSSVHINTHIASTSTTKARIALKKKKTVKKSRELFHDHLSINSRNSLSTLNLRPTHTFTSNNVIQLPKIFINPIEPSPVPTKNQLATRSSQKIGINKIWNILMDYKEGEKKIPSLYSFKTKLFNILRKKEKINS